MLQSIMPILGGLLKSIPFIGTFLFGRKTVENKVLKDAIKTQENNSKVTKKNKKKSDKEVFKELRKKHSRMRGK